VSGGGSATSGWHIDGGTLELAGGAPLTATTVSSGGVLVVESGAVANVTQVKGGGTAVIEPGGSAFATTVSSGGAIEFISGSTASAHLNPGAIVEFGPGEVLSNVNVSGGTTFEVLAGGSALGNTQVRFRHRGFYFRRWHQQHGLQFFRRHQQPRLDFGRRYWHRDLRRWLVRRRHQEHR
jgi:autotransporter passenger strand-loop-strand repeat protein